MRNDRTALRCEKIGARICEDTPGIFERVRGRCQITSHRISIRFLGINKVPCLGGSIREKFIYIFADTRVVDGK